MPVSRAELPPTITSPVRSTVTSPVRSTVTSPVRSAVTSFVAAAGDLLLGAVCPGCGAPGLGLCPPCRSVVESASPGRCRPDPAPPGFPLTTCCGPYEDPYRSMIIAHKEDGALLLAPVLGRLLAAAVDDLLRLTRAVGEPVELVPMASSAAAVRRRGYDAIATMTRDATARLRRRGRDVRVTSLLRQRRTVADQSGLDAEERRRNLAGGLRIRSGDRPDRTGWLVLTDDVVTTGATLTEATSTLRDAGYRVLGAATVAATQRHARQAARPLSTD